MKKIKEHKLLTFNIVSTLAIVLMLTSIIVINTNNSYALSVTTYTCPSGYKRVSNTAKCCPRNYSNGIVNNKCYASCMYNTANGQRAGLCYGKAPVDATVKTKSGTTYVHFYTYPDARTYTVKTCNEALCNMTTSYTCPTGMVFAGWATSKGLSSGVTSFSVRSSFEDQHVYRYAACATKKTEPSSPSNNPNPSGPANNYQTAPNPTTTEPVQVCPKSTNTTKAEIGNNYKITYNLDGGHFPDGSTTRTELAYSNNPVGDLKLNPLKQGYRFIMWKDSNGKQFDFNTKPTANVTLTATYEKLEDDYYEEYSCSDKNDILDPTTNNCYKILKFGTNGQAANVYSTPYGQDNQTPTQTTAYNYTKNSYAANQRFCWGWNSPNEGDSGAINLSSYTPTSIIGKNNAKYYYKDGDKFVAYDNQDWWKSIDTCDIGKACQALPCVEETNYPACDIQYSAIIYKQYDAKYTPKEVELPKEDDEEDNSVIDDGTDNNDDNDNDKKNDNDKENDVIKTNVETGILSVLIIAIIGVVALINIFNFAKKKNIKETV